MANEFAHVTVGVNLTQTEYEAIGGHLFNSQATGDILYASSATQLSRLGIGAAGTILTTAGSIPAWSTLVFINETANTKMTTGLTINQGAADNEILALKSSNVAQSWVAIAEADTYATFLKAQIDSGGLMIRTFKDADDDNFMAFRLESYLMENVDTTKSTAGRALIELFASQISGDARADIVANGNILGVQARVGGANVSVLLLDEDGDLWLNGGIVTGGATPLGYFQNVFGGNFTSDGASTLGGKQRFEGTITGASGDTSTLEGTVFINNIVTQTAAETIGVVTQVYMQTPTITKNVTTITTAATLYIGSAPTEGTTNAAICIAAGDQKWLGSVDSAAIADQVAIGGYEIGASNRVLAISQETAVAVDTDETKFSNKVQCRINGATYFIMLTAT